MSWSGPWVAILTAIIAMAIVGYILRFAITKSARRKPPQPAPLKHEGEGTQQPADAKVKSTLIPPDFFKKLFWIGIILGGVVAFFSFREGLEDPTNLPWVMFTAACVVLLLLLFGLNKLTQKLFGRKVKEKETAITPTVEKPVPPVVVKEPADKNKDKATTKKGFFGKAVLAGAGLTAGFLLIMGIVDLYQNFPRYYASFVGDNLYGGKIVRGQPGDTPEDARRRRLASNPQANSLATSAGSYDLVTLTQPKDRSTGWQPVSGNCVVPDQGEVWVIYKKRTDAQTEPKTRIDASTSLDAVMKLGTPDRSYRPLDGVSSTKLRVYKGRPGCVT